MNTKKPFILGGEYDISNLFLDSIENIINFKLDLAKQLLNIKDGDQIKI